MKLSRVGVGLALFAGLIMASSSFADIVIKDGNGVSRTIVNFVCQTTKFCNATMLIKEDGTQVGTALQPIYVNGIGAAADSAPTTFSPIGALGSGATLGLNKPVRVCDLYAKYDGSATGAATLVTGVASRKVYICGYKVGAGSVAMTALGLVQGSDANCATNQSDLTPQRSLTTFQEAGHHAPFWSGIVTTTNAYYVCKKANAATAHWVEVYYTQQ